MQQIKLYARAIQMLIPVAGKPSSIFPGTKLFLQKVLDSNLGPDAAPLGSGYPPKTIHVPCCLNEWR